METEQCGNCIYYRKLKHNFELRKGFEDSNCCVVWTKIEDDKNAWVQEVDEYDMCEMFTPDAGNMGEIIENLEEIAKALDQEPTIKNGISNKSIIYKAKESKEIQENLDKLSKLNEPATKNDLGIDVPDNNVGNIDCISRNDVERIIESDYGLCWNENDYYDRLLADLEELPSVTPQEPRSFKWCTDCKEYDQEKHCCHRYSKVIRDTVAEIEQEPITKNDLGVDAVSRQSVLDLIADYDLSMGQVVRGIHALPPVNPQEPILDKIRTEIIEMRSRQNVGVLECLDIIDKYKAESEDKE